MSTYASMSFDDEVEYIRKKSRFGRLGIDAYNSFNKDVIASQSSENYKTKADTMVDEFPR